MFLIVLSPTGWLIIIAVVLLLFGAGALPKLARALGESKRALREGMSNPEDQ